MDLRSNAVEMPRWSKKKRIGVSLAYEETMK